MSSQECSLFDEIFKDINQPDKLLIKHKQYKSFLNLNIID